MDPSLMDNYDPEAELDERIIDVGKLLETVLSLRVRIEELESEKAHLMKKNDEFSSAAHENAVELRKIRIRAEDLEFHLKSIQENK